MQNTDPYRKETNYLKLWLAVGLAWLIIGAGLGFSMIGLGIGSPKQESPALAENTPDPQAGLASNYQPTPPALTQSYMGQPPAALGRTSTAPQASFQTSAPINAAQPSLSAPVPQTQPSFQSQQPQPQAVQQVPVRMPDDVYNWLEHLRKTDERLASEVNSIGMNAGVGSLAGIGKAYSQAMGEDNGYDARTLADSMNARTMRAFQELQRSFESYPPPTECIPTYNAYKASLVETSASVQKIMTLMDQAFDSILNGGSPDRMINELMALSSGHRDGIDENRRQTDYLVQQTCTKYETRKWFNIKSDPANPMMKGMVDILSKSIGN